MRALRICLTGSLLVTTSAWSHHSYECKVSASARLQSDGKMTQDGWTEMFVGKSFVVDRPTGRVIGKSLVNYNDYGQPQILDKGGNDNAYKVITLYAPNVTVDYLYIRDFDRGDRKAFFFIQGGITHSGVCMSD